MLQRIEKAEQQAHRLVVLSLIAGSRYHIHPFREVARDCLIQGVDLIPQGHWAEIELPVAGPALDIVADGEGTIWITVPRAHAICRLRPGTPITAFNLPATAIPAFIAGGTDGNLYFTEPTGKIARFTPAGVLTEFKLTD